MSRLSAPTTHLLLLLLSFPLVGCECELKSSTPGPKAAPATPAAPALAPTGLVVCARVEGKRCVEPVDRFGPDVPEVHATLVTTTVPKTPTANMMWIAEETGGAAPPNYTIASKALDLSGVDLKQADHVSVNGRLTRPTKGWPLGRYRVEVQMDGKVVATKKFEIK